MSDRTHRARPVADGTIEIRGLRAPPYLVDVRLRADVAAAVRTDDLSFATDIGRVAAAVRAALASATDSSVERIAGDVARALLEGFAGVSEATVTLTRARVDTGAETFEVTARR